MILCKLGFHSPRVHQNYIPDIRADIVTDVICKVVCTRCKKLIHYSHKVFEES